MLIPKVKEMEIWNQELEDYLNKKIPIMDCWQINVLKMMMYKNPKSDLIEVINSIVANTDHSVYKSLLDQYIDPDCDSVYKQIQLFADG